MLHFRTVPALALLFALASGLSLFPACDKEDDSPEPAGDIVVEVRNFANDPVAGATVTTDPETQSLTTDAFGTATFRNLPVKTFGVVVAAGGRTDKQSARVVDGQLTRLTFQFDIRNPPASSGAPVLTFVSPTERDSLYADEAATFEATVTDVNSLPGEVRLNWYLNGSLIRNQLADAGGKDRFTYVLPAGYHNVEVAAVNPGGARSSLTRNFAVGIRPIRLATPLVNGREVTLRWSRYSGGTQAGYEVQRSTEGACPDRAGYGWTTIHTLDKRTDTSYVATVGDPFVTAVCFRIIPRGEYYPFDGASNVASIRFEALDLLPFTPTEIAAHPTDASKIYLLDRGLERVVLYDFVTKNTVATAQLSGKLGEPIVADAGQGMEVFVPSDNGYVTVLDPTTLAVRLRINNQVGVHSLAVFEDGFVMVAGLEDQWSSSRFKTYARSSGQLIAIATPSFGSTYPGKIARVPGRLAAVAIDIGLSPASAHYFELDAKGKFVSYSDDAYHGDFYFDAGIFEVSPTGEYFVSNSDASIYTANSQLSFRGRLDHSGIAVRDFAFSADGTTIYSAIGISNYGSSDPQTRGVIVSAYPSRLRDRIIVTGGFCYRLVRLADGKIGSLQVGKLPEYYSEIAGPSLFAIVEGN